MPIGVGHEFGPLSSRFVIGAKPVPRPERTKGAVQRMAGSRG